MRKLKLFIACSLDGYIARHDGSIDWLYTDADYGYQRFYDGVDTVLMGRRTYELLLQFDQFPYPDKECMVFSRHPERLGNTRYGGTVTFKAEDAVKTVEALKALPERRDIWLVGGGEVTHALREADLINDFIISIHPILLGSGIPLFHALDKEDQLKLLSCNSFPSGLVQLHYQDITASVGRGGLPGPALV